MKRRLKKNHVFLIIGFSFFVLGFLAYFHCWNLIVADFHFSDLSFENPDQDNLLTDHVNELKICGSDGLSGVSLLENSVFEQLPLISFRRSCPEPQTLPLRC
jgi:hypothetical protein